ncbi:hypothetical protein MRB53_026256 [Persea americana]|uniref:Uncharacterized protein n=1 Tax=Persea americana TaxID=3435 RepID=A0ACC2LHU5_PERAE|nr:hypothetical protein MRB53_026256 [Persea americana]
MEEYPMGVQQCSEGGSGNEGEVRRCYRGVTEDVVLLWAGVLLRRDLASVGLLLRASGGIRWKARRGEGLLRRTPVMLREMGFEEGKMMVVCKTGGEDGLQRLGLKGI